MARLPNVIVFFTDQQRWDVSGLHGCPLDLMPVFDRMAHAGTHIEHSITCQPVCGPARAAFQSGQYPTKIGCWKNGIPLPREIPTLAGSFAGAGYRTGYIGKWHLAEGALEGPVPKEERGGYEYWLASNLLEFTSDAYSCVVYDGEGREVRLPGYRVDALTDAAIRFVQESAEGPFFLFLSFLEPHHQNHRDDYPAPEALTSAYVGRWMPPDLEELRGSAARHLAGYFGMVKRLDEALGRVRDALISLGLLEDTIVLFTSDHACHFKTRNSEYKRACEDDAVRVPTALYGGPFTGGGRITKMVSLIDLPPSLLDACGIKVPEEMQGRSFLPLLGGRAADWPEEAFIQISESQVGRAIRTLRWKYAVVDPDADGCAVAGSERYVECFLYDLMSDPYELNNLVHHESHARVREKLRARLIERMVEAGEAAPAIEPAEVRVPTGQWRVDDPEMV